MTRFDFGPAADLFGKTANELTSSDRRALYYRSLARQAAALSQLSRFKEADSILAVIERNAPGEIGADHQELANAYLFHGWLRGYETRYREAIDYTMRCLAIRKKNRGPDDPYVGGVYFALGQIYNRAGTYNAALHCLDTALSIQEKAYGRDNADVAATMAERALALASSGDHLKAIREMRNALAILFRLNLARSPKALRLYQLLAREYYELGYYDLALENDTKALGVSRALFDEYSVAAASALSQFGDDIAAQGDYGAATQYYHEALSIFDSLSGKGSSQSLGIERRLAGVLSAQGDLDSAAALMMSVAEHAPSFFGPMHPHMAYIYLETADILGKYGDWRGSLDYARRAFLARSAVKGPKFRLQVAEALQRIGQAYLQGGELDSARTALEAALAMQDSSDMRSLTLLSKTYAAIGEVASGQGRPVDALQMYQRSLNALADVTGDSSAAVNPSPPGKGYNLIYVDVLKQKAELLERISGGDTNTLRAALACYGSASAALEQLLPQYRSQRSKLLLQTSAHPVYSAGLRISERLYAGDGAKEYLESAFSFAERSKAAVLQEGMQEARAVHFSGIPDSVVAWEEELSRNLAAQSVRMQQVEERNVGGSELESQRKALFAAGERLRHFQEEMEQLYPQYARLRSSSRLATTAEVRKILERDECVVEYCLGDSAIYTLVVARDTTALFAQPKPPGLDLVARDLTRSIKTMEKEEYVRQARKLYDVLVGPIAECIEKYEKLVIIPDGSLYYVPFEALLGPFGRKRESRQFDFSALPYLIRSHDISYAFSASLLAGSARRESSIAAGKESFAGFAPVFGDTESEYSRPVQAFADASEMPDARSITLDGKTFNALPYSETEVRSALSGFKAEGSRTIGFFRSDATKKNFLANAGKYGIVHIATHGYVNENHPELSALLFYPDKNETSPEEAVLYAGETYNLHLNADLVVLSSCESGVGKLVRGEGLMAMARGFFFAGARNLIFSLWKVSDRHSDELMQAFYNRLLGGKSLANALRRAKLQLVSRRATAFPLKWAGFVLLGE